MIAHICFFLFCLLALRSLILVFAESKPLLSRLFDLVLAVLFGLSATALVLFLGLHLWDISLLGIGVSLVAFLLVFLSLIIRLQRPHESSPVLLVLKTFFVLILACLSLFALMMSGFLRLTEDEPVLKIIMSGNQRQELLEWKPPEGALQKQNLPAYEVVFQTPDGKPVSVLYVYGDQVAIKAKVIRFRPILNVVGISNLCKIEYVYNGYTTAQRFNLYPHRAQEISLGHPALASYQKLFWSFWERLYTQQSENWWVKSATLESGYFPLVYSDGTPFRGAYYLTITPGGLSSVPLP